MTARMVATIVVGLFVALLVVGFIRDPFGWRKAKIERLEGRASVAEQSAALATNTVRIVERYHDTQTIITQQAEASADAVSEIPSDELDPALRQSWLDGLRNVRAAANDNRPD